MIAPQGVGLTTGSRTVHLDVAGVTRESTVPVTRWRGDDCLTRGWIRNGFRTVHLDVAGVTPESTVPATRCRGDGCLTRGWTRNGVPDRSLERCRCNAREYGPGDSMPWRWVPDNGVGSATGHARILPAAGQFPSSQYLRAMLNQRLVTSVPARWVSGRSFCRARPIDRTAHS
jgi:hypothetical protein